MPGISIITAVRNGLPAIEFAYKSICRQTFNDWEWLVVDDASTDGTATTLQAWAAEDSRIKPLLNEENQGPAAARNTALRAAQGEFIVYLDHDDEYYPDYLENVVQMRDKGDVLLFGYDMIKDDDPQAPTTTWDPHKARDMLFTSCMVTPLGLAHRRDLVDRVGEFNELLWHDEDSDFIRRLARAGTQFAFVQAKSGIYHIRSASASRTPRVTQRQRTTFLENWRAGRPLFAGRNGGSEISNRKNRVKKVAFVSPHCVLDFTNGAATATLDGLSLLARSGFECQAFCSSRMDAWEEVLVEEVLAQRGVGYQVRNAQIGPHRRRMIFTTHGQVGVTLFNTGSTRGGWMSNEEIAAFLTACEIFLTKNRPDVVWTYGGDPVSCAIQELAERLDIPILFALHNFNYSDPVAFQMVDYVIVPTEFCRQFYWETIGLASLYLPLVVDPDRVQIGNGPHPGPLPEREGDRRYATLVNPEPRKGIHFFARIAEVLAQRRPDIPLLIVEGAGIAGFLSQLGIDLSGLKNLRILPNSPDARGFLAMTRLLVMPSLMENAGLVAMEAMSNGIPVLASSRGGLPETIGDAGLVLDIPQRYTPDTRDVPTAQEVEPWVETIIRLWDDRAEYDRWSRAARERAQQWHPDRLAAVYSEFFGNLTHQPGPPLVPRELVLESRETAALPVLGAKYLGL